MHRLRPGHLAVLAALAALSSLAGAQEHVLAAASWRLFELEIESGVVVDPGSIDLRPITPFNMPQVWTAGWIEGEVWVGTNDGVLRYSGSPLAYIDRFALGTDIVRIIPSPSGAFISMRNGPLVEVDSAGVLLQTFTFPSTVDDIEPYRDGYLVITGDQALYTDTSLGVIAEFGPLLDMQVRAVSSFFFDPRRAAVLSDGRVAFSCETFVVIVRADGNLQDFVQAGSFEQNVFETGGGLVLVPGSGHLILLDPDTIDFFAPSNAVNLGGVSTYSKPFTRPAGTSSTAGRGCSASINSTGRSARIHALGSPSTSLSALAMVATALPPATLAMPIFGVNPFDAPFGDGRLCVSPFAPGLTRAPVTLSTSHGSTRTAFDFTTPGLGAAFGPGTTWYFQVLYRDPTGPGGSGFNGTDGVFISFEP